MALTRKEQSRKFYLAHREEIKLRVREYRKKNIDAIRARGVAKYHGDPEFRAKAKAYQKDYRRRNKNKIRESQRIYRKKHWESRLREYYNSYHRTWSKTPAGKHSLANKSYRRRALFKDIGSHTLAEWEDIKQKYGQRCAECRKRKTLTKDHIIALTKGGRNTADNIQPMCLSCNARKGNS